MRLFDFINDGGSISWILVAMNIVGLSLILWRFIVLKSFKKNITSMSKVFVGEFQQLYQSGQASQNMDVIKDFISQRVHELEFGMNSIKVIATSAPLFGLLGTVIGIYEAFQVISETGMEDPSRFASAISYALITTIVGLIVAIPHFIAHNYLSGELDSLEIRLEKNMTPMLQGK